MLMIDDQKRREPNSRRGAAFVLSIVLLQFHTIGRSHERRVQLCYVSALDLSAAAERLIQPFQFGYAFFERPVFRMQSNDLRL